MTLNALQHLILVFKYMGHNAYMTHIVRFRVLQYILMTTIWHMTSLYVHMSYVVPACLGDIETCHHHRRTTYILVICNQTPIGLHTRVQVNSYNDLANVSP